MAALSMRFLGPILITFSLAISAILIALSRYTFSVFGKENRPLAF
jgi:hypothetical protein